MIIPEDISIYGVYTGQIILFAILVALYKKHYYLSVLGFILYITTMIHWSKMFPDKYLHLDRFIAISVFLFITLYYAVHHFKPEYRNIWFIVGSVAAIVFLLNEYIYASYLQYPTFSVELLRTYQTFSVLVHLLFTHILMTIAYIYCSLM